MSVVGVYRERLKALPRGDGDEIGPCPACSGLLMFSSIWVDFHLEDGIANFFDARGL